MLKKFIGLFLMFFLCTPLLFAQEATLETSPPAEAELTEDVIRLTIQAPSEVQVGRNVIFRAGNIEGLSPEEQASLQLSWDLGDGARQQGTEVVHTYEAPGQYLVKLTVDGAEQQYEVFYEMFVYERLYVVVLDSEWDIYKDKLLENAREQSVYLSFVELNPDDSLLSGGADPTVIIGKAKDHMQEASLIIAGEDGRRALDALSSFKKGVPDFDFSAKRIVVSSTANLFIFQRIASRNHSMINSRELLLTNDDLVSVLYDLLTATDEEKFLENLKDNDEVTVVDKTTEALGPTNFISYFINEGISKGIPGDLFLFILLLPVIATTIAFFKQVIGLDTLGVFMPSVLTLSFVVLGLKYALFILLVIVLVNIAIRAVLKHFYLLYVPKMALVVSVSALAMLCMLFVGVYFDITFGIDVSQSSRAILSIFPMIIMAMLAEQMMNIQNSKGPRSALRIISEMIFTCVLVYGLVTAEFTKIFIFAYPEVAVILTLCIDVFLGRFTGLRLMEYLRFRDLLFHESEE